MGCSGVGVTTYSYSSDTRLDTVTLPDGTQITYYYGAGLGHVEKHINGVLAESYIWHDATRLSAWIDHVRGIRCMFHYGSTRSPVAVTVEHEVGTATFRLGFDQVGTLKLVASPDGKLIKEMVYDSFGNMYADSNPELFLPIGFASGLVDRHTGLIRFGYRDYDPEIGRFTADQAYTGRHATCATTEMYGITAWMIRLIALIHGGWRVNPRRTTGT